MGAKGQSDLSQATNNKVVQLHICSNMFVVQLTILVCHRSIDYCLIGSWPTGQHRNCHLCNCLVVEFVFGQLKIGEMAVCSVILLLNLFLGN